MFWAADKYMRVEMISSAIQVYFVLAHSWTLQSPALFVFTWTLYPMCQEPIADVQKDWQNENEIMKKKMRLINTTSLTVICLALRTPVVWQLI